ncbi:MAG: hypothetical protein R3A10_19850 [Caldilineaceae bacterium]
MPVTAGDGAGDTVVPLERSRSASERAAAAHGTESPRRERWHWSLAGIVLASVLGNLYWLRQNIVLVGRDSTGHLERTLKAAEVLTHVNPSSLFAALTIHDYRPPLLYVAAQPFYRLFGISLDSAQLTNVFFSRWSSSSPTCWAAG